MMIAQVAALPPLHWQFHSAASTLVLISLTPVHSFSYLCRECTSSHLSHHSRTGWPLNIKPNKQEQLWLITLRTTAGTSQPESSILMEILNGTSWHRWNANESIYVSCSYLTPQRLTGHWVEEFLSAEFLKPCLHYENDYN